MGWAKRLVGISFANVGLGREHPDTNVKDLCESIFSPPKLTIVNLRKNSLSDEWVKLIVAVIEDRYTIEILHLEGNDISNEAKEILHKSWANASKQVADGVTLRGLYV